MTTLTPRIVIMGVSAVGKSTVGSAVAAELGVPFLDGDDLHTPQSVAKMSRGQPLDDQDRAPWLRACGRALANAPGGGVLACSALTRRYRRILANEAPDAIYIHLAAHQDRVALRAQSRSEHFMDPTLLDSQYATLEPLEADEGGLVVDADQAVESIVGEVLVHLVVAMPVVSSSAAAPEQSAALSPAQESNPRGLPGKLWSRYRTDGGC